MLERFRAAAAQWLAPRGKVSGLIREGGWDVYGSSALGFATAGAIWDEKLNRTTGALEDLARVHVAVYACVRRICAAAQEAPVALGLPRPDSPGGWEDTPRHPLATLLARPNPAMDYASWQHHVLLHLLLTGETFIWKWRTRGGAVAELWPIPTSWVRPRESGGYEITQGSGRPPVVAPETDLVRLWLPDPGHPLRALGPLHAALRDVRVDEQRQDYQMELLTNNRRPGVVFKQPDEWGEDQKQEFRSAISAGLGDGGRGKPLFLQGEKSDVITIPAIAELDWPGLTALSETRICAAFGVPPIVAGLRAGLETATYSNYREAVRAFYEGAMVSTWNVLDAGFTRGLLRDEGEPLTEIYHDVAAVPALQEDSDKRATRAAQLLGAGLATVDEARALCGLEPLPGGRGEVFLRGMTVEEVPLVGAPAREPPPRDDGSARQSAP